MQVCSLWGSLRLRKLVGGYPRVDVAIRISEEEEIKWECVITVPYPV